MCVCVCVCVCFHVHVCMCGLGLLVNLLLKHQGICILVSYYITRD